MEDETDFNFIWEGTGLCSGTNPAYDVILNKDVNIAEVTIAKGLVSAAYSTKILVYVNSILCGELVDQ